MKRLVYIMLACVFFVACSHKSNVQCRKLKPIKHKKYRVKKNKRGRNAALYASSSRSGNSVSSKKAGYQPSNSNTNTSVVPKESQVTAEEQEEQPIETVIEPTTVEPETPEEPKEPEPEKKEPIYYLVSNIQRQTFEVAEDQAAQFDPDHYIRSNNTLFELKENITFYQKLVYTDDLNESLGQNELGTALNDVSLALTDPSKKVKIYKANQKPFFQNGQKKDYELVHILKDDVYEVYKQHLSGLDEVSMEQERPLSENNQKLNQLITNRVEQIHRFLLQKGVNPNQIEIINQSSRKAIFIEVQ